MALPPKGDPRRPMFLAMRVMWILGILILMLICTLFTSIFLDVSMRAIITTEFIVKITFCYLTPSLLYLLCAIFLKRRQRWAIITGIIVASIHLLLASVRIVGMVTALINRNHVVPAWVGIAIMVLFMGALTRLIYHLAKSFEAIKYLPDDARGFEVLRVEENPPA